MSSSYLSGTKDSYFIFSALYNLIRIHCGFRQATPSWLFCSFFELGLIVASSFHKILISIFICKSSLGYLCLYFLIVIVDCIML